LLIVVGAMGMLGGGDPGGLSSACAGDSGSAIQPTPTTSEPIPPEYERLYKKAGEDYGIPWQILAGIGDIETDHGRLQAPGVTSGENSAGAGGPMQFIQGTWNQYGVDGDGDGDRDRYDPADAIPAAANYLVASNIQGSVHDAIFAYNHAEWYVADVIARAQGYGWTGDGTGGIASADPPSSASGAPGHPSSTTTQGGGGETGLVSTGCGTEFPAGPAQLNQAVKLTGPSKYVQIPPQYTAGGAYKAIDERILPNVVWILSTYNLIVIQGRGGQETGSPSVSHNYGTALDMVPARGNSQEIWDQSAGRLAHDLGWIPSCGASGVRPACPLVPAIRFIGYDGYPSHGSPRTCTGGCPAHIHVSWEGGDGAVYDGVLRPPLDWVLVFPSPAGPGGGGGGGGGANTAGENPPGSSSVPDEQPRRAGNVLVVGDSLAVGTGPTLKSQLGDKVTLDTLTGRSSTAGLTALQSDLSSDYDTVVFDLGTNDGSAETLKENLRKAGNLVGDRCMVVATINHPGGAGSYNDVINEFAGANSRVEVVDWYSMTQHDPSLLAGDGIHSTGAGYSRRGATMMSALGRC
jgi:lysophospholipase L1-like esterase